MPGHDIIVVGASAGGVEALVSLARSLPPDLPAAVFVVLHLPANANSQLPEILGRAGPLPAVHRVDGAPIEPGRIYAAPPDHHLLVRHGEVGLSRGPRENRHRPAVDVLFRSAARAYGTRVVSVVLSGALDDGAAGSAAVKGRGGAAVAQDPGEALFPAMPRNAIQSVAIDHVVPVAEMGGLLGRLAHEPVSEVMPGVSREMEQEIQMAENDLAAMSGDDRPGIPSVFGCPDCGGVLWEIQDDQVLRFRCRVGHAYSSGSLLDEQGDVIGGSALVRPAGPGGAGGLGAPPDRPVPVTDPIDHAQAVRPTRARRDGPRGVDSGRAGERVVAGARRGAVGRVALRHANLTTRPGEEPSGPAAIPVFTRIRSDIDRAANDRAVRRPGSKDDRCPVMWAGSAARR